MIETTDSWNYTEKKAAITMRTEYHRRLNNGTKETASFRLSVSLPPGFRGEQ